MFDDIKFLGWWVLMKKGYMRRGILCGLLSLMLITVSCSTEELLDSNEETIDLVEEEIEEDVVEEVDENVEEGNDDEVEDINEGTDTLSISEEILILVNQHRESIGKLALIRNASADNLATEHSNYMITKGAISHDNFILRFQKLQQEVNANAAGENVAAGYTTANSVMQGWIKSPGHKANIEGDFTHIGIAAVKDSNGRYYYTQLFYR